MTGGSNQRLEFIVGLECFPLGGAFKTENEQHIRSEQPFPYGHSLVVFLVVKLRVIIQDFHIVPSADNGVQVSFSTVDSWRGEIIMSGVGRI